MYDMTVHIGQSTVNSVVAHGELLVVDTQLVQDRGVDVVAARRVVPVGWAEAPLVAFAVSHPAADATTGEPVGEHERVVIAALAALRARHSAKLSRPEDQRVLEHSALLEVEH